MTAHQSIPTDDYVCALCYVPLFFNKMRFIPDILCFDCHKQWQSERYTPWLDELCKIERRRRERLRKLRRGGYGYETASLDLLFGGEDLIDYDADGAEVQTAGNEYHGVDEDDDPDTAADD